MTRALVVAGTDTGIGKTVASAALVHRLAADYWKPVQSGLDGETDRETVARLSGAAADRLHPEAYRLATPVSPHRAAEIDGVEIDPGRLRPPLTRAPLVIEGAGGLLVPMTRRLLQIDVFAAWGFPVVLVSPTRLGCINHALLSLEAMQRRAMTIAAILFVGAENADSQRTILEFAGLPSAGRLPWRDPLDPQSLQADAHAELDIAPLAALLERSE